MDNKIVSRHKKPVLIEGFSPSLLLTLIAPVLLAWTLAHGGKSIITRANQMLHRMPTKVSQDRAMGRESFLPKTLKRQVRASRAQNKNKMPFNKIRSLERHKKQNQRPKQKQNLSSGFRFYY